MLGNVEIGSDFQAIISNILRRGGRGAKMDFENLVMFGAGFRQDIQRDAVVTQVGIRGQLESELKGTLFLNNAFIREFSNFFV